MLARSLSSVEVEVMPCESTTSGISPEVPALAMDGVRSMPSCFRDF
jgi:hypothetical protein